MQWKKTSFFSSGTYSIPQGLAEIRLPPESLYRSGMMELTPEILADIPLHPVMQVWQPPPIEVSHTKGFGHDSPLSHDHQQQLEGKEFHDWSPFIGKLLALLDFAPVAEGPFEC